MELPELTINQVEEQLKTRPIMTARMVFAMSDEIEFSGSQEDVLLYEESVSQGLSLKLGCDATAELVKHEPGNSCYMFFFDVTFVPFEG